MYLNVESLLCNGCSLLSIQERFLLYNHSRGFTDRRLLQLYLPLIFPFQASHQPVRLFAGAQKSMYDLYHLSLFIQSRHLSILSTALLMKNFITVLASTGIPCQPFSKLRLNSFPFHKCLCKEALRPYA